MNIGLIIVIAITIAAVGIGIVLVSNVFSDNKKEKDIVKYKNNDNYSKSYYDINDIDIFKLGDTISWSMSWGGTVYFYIKKPLGDKYNYFNCENNENGIIVITDNFTDVYDDQTIDSVMEQDKNQIFEYLNKSLESDIDYNIIFNKKSIKNISSSSKVIRTIYSEFINSEKFENTSYDMVLYDGKIINDINKEMKFKAFVVQSSIHSTYYTYMLIIDGTDDQSIDNTVLEKYALDMAHSFYEHK